MFQNYQIKEASDKVEMLVKMSISIFYLFFQRVFIEKRNTLQYNKTDIPCEEGCCLLKSAAENKMGVLQ